MFTHIYCPLQAWQCGVARSGWIGCRPCLLSFSTMCSKKMFSTEGKAFWPLATEEFFSCRKLPCSRQGAIFETAEAMRLKRSSLKETFYCLFPVVLFGLAVEQLAHIDHVKLEEDLQLEIGEQEKPEVESRKVINCAGFSIISSCQFLQYTTLG